MTFTVIFFFPLAICGYWVTLTPKKLIFPHLICLIGGEQFLCRPAQATGKPGGFIKAMTSNHSGTCDCGMRFFPHLQLAAAWWRAQGRSSGVVASPSSRRIPGEGTGAASSSCPRPLLGQDVAQSRHPRTFTEWEHMKKDPGQRLGEGGGEGWASGGWGNRGMRRGN